MGNRAEKNRSYFEGWYLKHQKDGHTVAFIPGVHSGEDGEKSAFVQVITEQSSWYVPFSTANFHVQPRGFAVRVGGQVFSERGIRVDFNTSGLQCRGVLYYGNLTPPAYDVMGPFRLFPFLECNHGVLSMKHTLRGTLELNGQTVDFTGGTGYMEKDWGISFPKRYLWVQYGSMQEPSLSVMVSIAEIPFCGFVFPGCIALIYCGGKEYRLATYLGVRILRWDRTGFLIRQRGLLLEAEVLKSHGQNILKAPQCGNMNRVIRESASCQVRFRFYCNGRLLFDLTRDEASFEYAEGDGAKG
ncbi:MAG TPA: hypothetical protein GXX74_11480 [Clostridiales bacterium]|nr:hypothetical protein [Clostridiales bacterium]